jgi:outer membrane receptor protein involved in Fe transport
MTWSHGRHTFKFGGDFNHVADDTSNLRFESGGYTYSNINDFIIDYVHFQSPASPITNCNTTGVGKAPGRCYTSNYAQGIGILGLNMATNEYNFFAQDDFRITPRLTVNLGLRYEYSDAEYAVGEHEYGGYSKRRPDSAQATSTLPSDNNNFGPRIGFAYDVSW